MDFMNFMNQLNGSGCGNCGCDLNNGCMNNNNIGCGNSNILPLLLLAGLGNGFGQNNLSGGSMTCYPNNQCQQFITPTSVPYCGSNLRYKTRKVRQAYMEVPVSTYQVAQPFWGTNYPTTMNIMPVGGNRNGNGSDLWTILLLLSLLSRNNRNMCCQPQPRGCNNVSSEL